MAKASELRLLDDEELATRGAETRQELFNLRFQLATGQLENSARLGRLRREVAQVLTIQREREIEAAEAYQAEPGPPGSPGRGVSAGAEEESQ
ncbi:MAG TPA: 50S ribosomal protein L29 [Acidimicrobiales bacterium]|jgi:large subunit ribosomal protein L29|nr:50S ribosomal protein L29 [Acidimicrobiales bacterium]